MHLYEYQLLSQIKKDEVERNARHAWKWHKPAPAKIIASEKNNATQQLNCCEA